MAGGSGWRRAFRLAQAVPGKRHDRRDAAKIAQRRPGRALRAENAVLVVRRRLAVLPQMQKMVVAQSELPGEARQDCQRLQHGPRPHNDFSEAGGGPPGRPET